MNRNTKEKSFQPVETKLSWRLLVIRNVRFARRRWEVSRDQVAALKDLTKELQLSVAAGHLKLIECNWFVTLAGLLRIAQRNRCCGIRTAVDKGLSDPASNRWIFRATVYKSPRSRGFIGHGDASGDNVSPLFRGSEMRIAESRAVARALRGSLRRWRHFSRRIWLGLEIQHPGAIRSAQGFHERKQRPPARPASPP